MMIRTTQQGFTVVELIVVIIIMAIVSVAAISRFQGPASFSIYAAQAQSMAVIRQLQLARMQFNLANDFNTLTINQRCLGSVMACSSSDGSVSSEVMVLGQEVTFSVTPNTSQIKFDLLGRPLLSDQPLVAGDNYQITIASKTNEQIAVCINSEGFVHAC